MPFEIPEDIWGQPTKYRSTLQVACAPLEQKVEAWGDTIMHIKCPCLNGGSCQRLLNCEDFRTKGLHPTPG